MDSETMYFLFKLVMIGILSYLALRYITLQFLNNKTGPEMEKANDNTDDTDMDDANDTDMDDANDTDMDDANYKQRTGITDVTTDRSSEDMTAGRMSSSDDIVSDVPSRERIQEERHSEGVAANIMSSSDDTVSDVPSRDRVQEVRLGTRRRISLENPSDQYTIANDDTEDERDKINHDKEEYRVFQKFVDKTTLLNLTDAHGVLSGLTKFISKNRKLWIKRKLKIAIIGNSGTGKSSFINAIRGLNPEDKGAAPVGVTETTMAKQEFVLPSNENISLWDLPGVGTENFKKEDYLNAVKLEEFDAFMIVSATRFSENDVWLANEILKHDSNIFFLRTKIDQDLANEERDHPSTYNRDNCLENIRMEILRNLEKAEFPPDRTGVYLVSSIESSSFDFPKLLQRLNEIVRKKKFTLRKVLEDHLKCILEQKEKVKMGHFFWEKVKLIFDESALESCTHHLHKNCKMAFSLDDKSIRRVSKMIGMSENDLKNKELEYFKYEDEEKNKNTQFLNSFFGSFRIFRCRVNDVCHVLAKDEARLVHLLLNQLEKQLEPF